MSRLVRAFDAQRGVVVDDAAPLVLVRPLARPVRRRMSVKAALEWAFGVEHASLDFDDGRNEFERPGHDTIARLMVQGALGCEIDGGGRSLPADDAEIIASFVAILPEGHGGRSMAVRIAEMARVGGVPGLVLEAERRCVPLTWAAQNQHRPRAVVEEVPMREAGRWQRVVYRGRPSLPPTWCLVRYTPDAAAIAAARRDWLRWWGALLEIGHQLRTCADLRMIEVTQDMPPLEPWHKTS